MQYREGSNEVEGLQDDVEVKLERGPTGLQFQEAPEECGYALEVSYVVPMTNDGRTMSQHAQDDLDFSGEPFHPNSVGLRNVKVGMVLVSIGGRDLRSLPPEDVNKLLDRTPRPVFLRFRMFPFVKLKKQYLLLQSVLSSLRVHSRNLEESLRMYVERATRRQNKKEEEKKKLAHRLRELSIAYGSLYGKYQQLKKEKHDQDRRMAVQLQEWQDQIQQLRAKLTQEQDRQTHMTKRQERAGELAETTQVGYSKTAAAALEERDEAIKAFREARLDAEILENEYNAARDDIDKQKGAYQEAAEHFKMLTKEINQRRLQIQGATVEYPGADDVNYLCDEITKRSEELFAEKFAEQRKFQETRNDYLMRKAALEEQLKAVSKMIYRHQCEVRVQGKREKEMVTESGAPKEDSPEPLQLRPLEVDENVNGVSGEHLENTEPETKQGEEEHNLEEECIFKRILRAPDEALKIARESLDSSRGVLTSWLLKKSKMRKSRHPSNFKRRYVILSSGDIFYSQYPGDPPKGRISGKDMLRVYEQPSKKGYEFVIEETNKIYTFRAETQEVRDAWISVVQELIGLYTKHASFAQVADDSLRKDSDLSD